MAVRYGPRWTRRAVLAAAGGVGVAGVLSGCSLFTPEEPALPPDPLEPLLASAHQLITRYQEAISAHPDLAPRLQPIQQAHEAHAEALQQLIGRSPSPPGTGEAGSPPAPSPAADPDDAAVLASLAELERAAAHQARLACLAAPAERTGLLGSITAARATHAEVLTWSD